MFSDIVRTSNCFFWMNLVYMKTRSTSPCLAITTTTTYRPIQDTSDTESVTDESEYDIDSFATINLLQGLNEGK
jgi:hypothetical protein